MGAFIKGDVVVIPFPFSDLSSSKKRPAIVIADLKGTDYIMLQITSKNTRDSYSIKLSSFDFLSGSLHQDSNIRPNKIFTLEEKLVSYKIGHVKEDKLKDVISKLIEIVTK